MRCGGELQYNDMLPYPMGRVQTDGILLLREHTGTAIGSNDKGGTDETLHRCVRREPQSAGSKSACDTGPQDAEGDKQQSRETAAYNVSQQQVADGPTSVRVLGRRLSVSRLRCCGVSG
jgi:hypothetical protein